MDTDQNWKSYGPEHKGQTITPDQWIPLDPETAKTKDDIFKVSNVEDFGCDGITVPAGSENNVDMVRGARLFVRNARLLAGAGQGAIVFKGSIDGWTVEGGTVPNGPKFGIEVGQFDNYWYPGRPPTRNGLVKNVNLSNAVQLKIVLWDADVPLVDNTKVKIVKVPKWIWLPYFLVMYIVVRLSGAKTK